MLSAKAYAKLTLSLEVLGERRDGYHEIKGVFQSLSLHDDLTFQPAPDLRLVVDTPALAGPGNLVLMAAHKLNEARGNYRGATITLMKGIPAGAGLGGGSSDAAAALKGLDRLWGLEMPPEELVQTAASVGSDVPFCLTGGTALVGGRGEKLTPLPTPDCFAVLVAPPFSLEEKTRRMYSSLRPSQFTSGQRVDSLVAALRQGAFPDNDLLFNAFEPVACRLFPGLEEYKRFFLEAGASGVHLAGSGPVLFTLERDVARATEVAERLRQEGLDVLVGKFLPRLGAL